MIGLDLELAPQSVDVILTVVHPTVFHHVISHSGMSAIGANHEIKVDFDLLGPASCLLLALHLEPSLTPVEVGSSQFVVEENLDVWHLLEDVQHPFVQTRPVDGKYGLRL